MSEEKHIEKTLGHSAKLTLENTSTFLVPSLGIKDREASKGGSPSVLDYIYLIPS